MHVTLQGEHIGDLCGDETVLNLDWVAGTHYTI